MMLQNVPSITMLLLSAGLAATGLQRGTGWLDRVVQYQKNKLFNEVKELAPINIKAELRPKPGGYEDSRDWDYNSVLRLLTLIRESEKAKPVHKALRQMLQPTRRIMMSMKESMHRFPSLKGDANNFYYDNDYTSAEEDAGPPVATLPEEEAVIVVSNPVEARLPSAQISVKLLREILLARARAARQMPTTTETIPWVEFVRNLTRSTDPADLETGNSTATDTTGDAGDDATTVKDGEGDGDTTGGENETTDGDSQVTGAPEGATGTAEGETGTAEGETAEPATE